MSRVVTLAGFALLVVVLGALEASARLGPRRLATFADVLDAAVRHPFGRAAALLVWLWTGWHLFAR